MKCSPSRAVIRVFKPDSFALSTASVSVRPTYAVTSLIIYPVARGFPILHLWMTLLPALTEPDGTHHWCGRIPLSLADSTQGARKYTYCCAAGIASLFVDRVFFATTGN